MAEIQPFAGLQYRDADLSRVLAPPYDVIPPAYRDELYARDPHNVVRVVLNRTAGRRGVRGSGGDLPAVAGRGRAAAADAAPALYVLEQSFAQSGRTLRRFGLLARFRAEDPERRRHPAPRAHARGGQGGPLARAARHARQLQPDLPDVPGPGGGFATLVARGDRPRRRPRSTPTTAGSGTGCGGSTRPGARRPLPVAPRRSRGLHRRRAPPPRDRAALPRRDRPRGGVDARLLHARSRRRASSSSPTTGSSRRDRRSRRRRGGWRAASALARRPDVAAAVSRGRGLDRALRLRPGRAGARARSWSRPRPGSERLLDRRGPGLPARARHLLPAPRRARAAARRPGRGGELRPLAGRGGGGPGERRAAASPS